MDILKFLEKDKNDNQKSNSGNKSTKGNYLTLSREEFRGCTYIYKPLLDVDGAPYRRIHNPMDLVIRVPDESGNIRRRNYSILGNPDDYGRLTEGEKKLYNQAKDLMVEVGEWGEEGCWISTRKLNVIFYAYSLALLDKNGNDKLQSTEKGFAIVNHTSADFLNALHNVRETKSKVLGGGTWISKYYDVEYPAHNIIVTTAQSDRGFGMKVTLDFMEREPVVTVDQLKEAQEQCKDLNELSPRASFNPDFFQEIVKVCSDWKKVKLAEKSSTPVESNLDKMKTEIADETVGNTGTPVTALGQKLPEGEPPAPTAEMKV